MRIKYLYLCVFFNEGRVGAYSVAKSFLRKAEVNHAIDTRETTFMMRQAPTRVVRMYVK